MSHQLKIHQYIPPGGHSEEGFSNGNPTMKPNHSGGNVSHEKVRQRENEKLWNEVACSGIVQCICSNESA